MKLLPAAMLLSLGCCSSVFAQSSVTLYGSVDVSVGYNNNVGGHSQWQEVSGNSQPDLWGLRGTEDLGGGMSASFVLENGFLTPTGTMTRSGYIFNRNAIISLGSERYGAITMGHTLTFSELWVNPMDASVMGYDFLNYHPGNIDELTGNTNGMSDNVVRYVSPNFNGFQAGAQIGLGNTTNFATGRSTGYAARYINGPIRAAVAYAVELNRPTAIGTGIGFASFQGVPGSTQYIADKLTNLDASISYQIGRFSLHGLYSRVGLQHAGFSDTFQTFEAGTNFRFVPTNLIDLSAYTATLAGHRWTQASVTEMVFLSKTTNIYAEVAYQHATGGAAVIYSNQPASNASQFAIRTGVHHSF